MALHHYTRQINILTVYVGRVRITTHFSIQLTGCMVLLSLWLLWYPNSYLPFTSLQMTQPSWISCCPSFMLKVAIWKLGVLIMTKIIAVCFGLRNALGSARRYSICANLTPFKLLECSRKFCAQQFTVKMVTVASEMCLLGSRELFQRLQLF